MIESQNLLYFQNSCLPFIIDCSLEGGHPSLLTINFSLLVRWFESNIVGRNSREDHSDHTWGLLSYPLILQKIRYEDVDQMHIHNQLCKLYHKLCQKNSKTIS